MAVAGRDVVVDHAGRLHEGIDDDRPAEFKALGLQRLGHGDGLGGRCGDLGHGGPVALDGLTSHEGPQPVRHVAALNLQVQPDTGALDGGVDLGPRADDAGIVQQALAVGLAVAGDLLRVETVEGGAEGRALFQDGDPRQARLESVQHQLFPEGARVTFGHAPFLVVIGDIEGVGAAPATAAGRVGHGRVGHGRRVAGLVAGRKSHVPSDAG